MRYFVSALLSASLLLPAAMSTGQEEPTLLDELRPAVETGLASDDVAVQSWAIRAAGLTGDRVFRDQIVGALENTNGPVRIAAAVSLIRMDYEEDEATERLATELIEGDAGTRGLLLESILLHMPESVREDVFSAALAGIEDQDVLRQVISHLAQRADGDVYALLERAARVDDADTRALYVTAVRIADRSIGLTVADALLDSSDSDKRLEGAEIAFAINTAEARAMLEPLLDSSDSALAQRVGFHLARYGNAAGLGLAADLALNTEMPENLRLDAMALLRDNGPQLISWPQIQAMLDEEGRSPIFVTRVHELAGATQSPEAIAHLRGLLDGLFADQRLEGIAGIGYAGQSDVIPTLSQILSGSGDITLRLRAAEALGTVGGEMAADVLVDALRMERVEEAKVAILDAIGATGATSAAQAVANQLALQDREVGLAALEALQALGAADIASQVESAAIAFRDPDVRWKATIVLTHLDAAAGRIRLMQALDRPPENFMDDLRGLPPEVRDEIDEQLLQHADQDIREAALFRVMRRADGGYGVLRPLVQAATHPDVRRQAIAVVTAARSAEDADLFRHLTTDTDRSIRLQGFAALAQLGDPETESFFRGYMNHADVALRLIATYALLNGAAGGS